MIVLICENFKVYKNGFPTKDTEYLVSCAYSMDNDELVVMPAMHPATLGARFNMEIGEWVLYE